MMDIVERLVREADYKNKKWQLFHDAAEEIRLLRESLSMRDELVQKQMIMLKEYRDFMPDRLTLATECEKLKADVVRLKAIIDLQFEKDEYVARKLAEIKTPEHLERGWQPK